MIKEAIVKVVEKNDLTRDEIKLVVEEIMSGQATSAQIASFLTALRIKGETVEEITGACLIMREHVTKIKVPGDAENAIDTCGTGGDESFTFNISTISSFVTAGAGLIVAKHGNRSVSSKCGSADLLEALGVNIEANLKKVEECLEKIGIGFLYAPMLHPAMKYATPVRREIGIRTIFNILGPLTNPCFAKYQLLGVYNEDLTEKLAKVLGNLGSVHCLVVHGIDGLDEVTTTDKTKISELKNGEVTTYFIAPGELGIKKTSSEELKVRNLDKNKEIALGVLRGKEGPHRDIVVLNSAAALYAGDKVGDIKEGIKLAEESINSGKALEKLELLKEYTNR